MWSSDVSAKQSPEDSQEEETEMFKKLYIDWKGKEQFKDSQYKAIPKFYFKVHMFYHDRHISCHYICTCGLLHCLQNVVLLIY